MIATTSVVLQANAHKAFLTQTATCPLCLDAPQTLHHLMFWCTKTKHLRDAFTATTAPAHVCKQVEAAKSQLLRHPDILPGCTRNAVIPTGWSGRWT